MIKYLDHTKMGRSNLGWLQSVFHFSFADYQNLDNINFGALRVINDDLIAPATGFDTHPHKDMEIITYVVNGEITHKDSMGHERTIQRGDAQYMSAGTGVYHSEYNYGDKTLRTLQIWIFPDEDNLEPQYGDVKFEQEQRHNQWLTMVSPYNGNAPIRIHQDAYISVIELDEGKETEFEVAKDRQAYLLQIEGSSDVNGIILKERDALESVEETLHIKALEKSHFLAINLKKEA